jgi:hypothetical protein
MGGGKARRCLTGPKPPRARGTGEADRRGIRALRLFLSLEKKQCEDDGMQKTVRCGYGFMTTARLASRLAIQFGV